MSAKVTIQIVGWNSAKHLPGALKALREIPAGEAVFRYIDNGSTDNSVAIVSKVLPQADIIKLGKNLGFAYAHNIGFTKCTTPFALTHDPDVRLSWPGAQALLTAFDDPKVAAVQGKLYRASNRVSGKIVDSAGIVLTLALNGKERGAGVVDRGQYEKPATLTAVTGACGLYRMKALKSISHRPSVLSHRFSPQGTPPAAGVLEIYDNEFFAYKEDVDLGWRLNHAGWKVLYLPVRLGTHKRTLGARGFMNWGVNLKAIIKRLRSPRTRYSLRNYVWMLIKNVTWRQEMTYEVFILGRLGWFFLLSLAYPPMLSVWGETLRGLPSMVSKRVIHQARQ
jgi:GT2 family glycosyltransferase